jgi:metal-dependent amidase/aminoacylase/carboxypeptidase family protein
LEITYRGVGGYSWGGFGNPSAIHSLGKCINAITEIHVPSKPKTIYNVGKITGGIAVNVVAPEAGMLIDLRSEDLGALNKLDQTIRETATRIAEVDGSEAIFRIVGEHPYGKLSENHPLRDIISEVQASLNISSKFVRGSSDVAVPLAAAIPSACLGITVGNAVGLLEEKIDIARITPGLKQVYLVLHLLLHKKVK